MRPKWAVNRLQLAPVHHPLHTRLPPYPKLRPAWVVARLQLELAHHPFHMQSPPPLQKKRNAFHSKLQPRIHPLAFDYLHEGCVTNEV